MQTYADADTLARLKKGLALRRPKVATVGEVIVALAPDAPVAIEDAGCFSAHVGGAETNVAISLAQLGVDVELVGRIGADPLGRRARRVLNDAGVGTRLLKDDPAATALYLREWLPDGERRPFYYRAGSAGTRLVPADWPTSWPSLDWIHITGVTAALGEGPLATLHAVRAWAKAYGVPVSFDPNFRRWLWSADEARPALKALLPGLQALLLGEEEAELIFGSTRLAVVGRAAAALGVRTLILRAGEKGAAATAESAVASSAGFETRAVDPVGAGDAFNAGFIAASLCGRPLAEALAFGNWLGARAVSHVGDSLVGRL